MRIEREHGGVRCGEVLARLSEYFDGGLDAAARARLEQHVAACELCTRFGGVFTHALRALRERLQAPAEVAPDVAARLRAALARARS